ncbi:MAG: YggT family protein [Solirubrobacteraceae bacterium MAG38_C4-C5]|nr:YggT family protein [Candidatus Siliceabacter maunaloa]
MIRNEIAEFVDALVLIYTIMIFAYIISSLVQSFGTRIPYARWSDALLTFLRQVCEPYLRLFRRFIPPLGPVDLSPIVAIFTLQIVGSLLVALIRG